MKIREIMLYTGRDKVPYKEKRESSKRVRQLHRCCSSWGGRLGSWWIYL